MRLVLACWKGESSWVYIGLERLGFGLLGVVLDPEESGWGIFNRTKGSNNTPVHVKRRRQLINIEIQSMAREILCTAMIWSHWHAKGYFNFCFHFPSYQIAEQRRSVKLQDEQTGRIEATRPLVLWYSILLKHNPRIEKHKELPLEHSVRTEIYSYTNS